MSSLYNLAYVARRACARLIRKGLNMTVCTTNAAAFARAPAPAGVAASRQRAFLRAFFHNAQGQICVEFAALMPVVIVVMLIAYNIVCYVQLCSKFDRCARDAIAVLGVSPPGKQSADNAASEIKTAIQTAMGEAACDVNVQAQSACDETGAKFKFFISPLLTTYTCKMSYKPWPLSVCIAGISVDFGARIDYTQRLVVDRFRPGVLV